MRKYQLPKGFPVEQVIYEKWLQQKVQSLIRRDRKWLAGKKTQKKLTPKRYKEAIHQAVCECNGRDAYTGEKLAWNLLSKYKNQDSKIYKRNYKKKFALLPTVDHVARLGVVDFKICAWRTNDAKSDLTLAGFIKLCKKVVEYNQ